MTEQPAYSDLQEGIKRLKLRIEQASSVSEKEKLSGELLELTVQKVGMGRRLDAMHNKMAEAAEVAEKSGVGTGGKGSSS